MHSISTQWDGQLQLGSRRKLFGSGEDKKLTFMGRQGRKYLRCGAKMSAIAWESKYIYIGYLVTLKFSSIQ